MATSKESEDIGKSYGFVGRRFLRGGRYQEIDVDRAGDELSRNPLEHWTQAYLRFTSLEGGKSIREAMQSIMGTAGLVAALVATLVVSALISPPVCSADVMSFNSRCENNYGKFVVNSNIKLFFDMISSPLPQSFFCPKLFSRPVANQ